MYPELWLHEVARERQREMRHLARGWARRGIGEEHLDADPRPSEARKEHLYAGQTVRLPSSWARRQWAARNDRNQVSC